MRAAPGPPARVGGGGRAAPGAARTTAALSPDRRGGGGEYGPGRKSRGESRARRNLGGRVASKISDSRPSPPEGDGSSRPHLPAAPRSNATSRKSGRANEVVVGYHGTSRQPGSGSPCP